MTIEEEGERIKEVKYRYRAFHTSSKYNSRLGIFDYCDLYELEALHVPISMDKVEFYRNNPNEPIITPTGEDGHIIKLDRERSYYGAAASSSSKDKKYIIVPSLLRVRRFQKVSSFDLETWESESKTPQNWQEGEEIIFVGQIPGIAVVREILEAINQGPLTHTTITSDRDQTLSALAKESPDGLLQIQDPFRAFNYESTFKAVGPCGFFDCPICYGALQIFPKRRLFLLGEPPDSPLVTKEAKRRKLKGILRIAKYLQILSIMNTMNTSEYDIMEQLKKEEEEEE